ncbi:MAG: DNA repair protein RecO [Candidatus Alkaliphilus sp. MAG34]|nr:DNA repair protein RecO [Clostridiales bacterium]
MLVTTEGFVLRNRKYRETDSLLTIFTRKVGKINAIAKGAHRPKSNLLAGIQPFSYSEFVLYKGRSLYSINQCEVKEIFYPLREDLKKLSYAAYLLELVESVITEGQTNNRLFNLLGRTLYILKEDNVEINPIIRAFEIKLMNYSGYRPHLVGCVHCANKQSISWKFSAEQGGLLCSSCFNIDSSAIRIRNTTVKLAIYLLAKDIEEIKDLKVSRYLNNELKNVLKQYILTYTNRYNFKSLEMAEKL